MTKPRYLTKSRFKLGMECPTKLFYTGNPLYPDKSIDDPFLLALADGGFAFYRISKLVPFVATGPAEDARAKVLRQKYAQVIADEEFSAWLSSLRQRYPVEINKKALETKER